MPNFVYPSLLWGLLLVGVPVLIHLINMLRHRRVRWAAMEFLLVSQKRNRTRVLLKQLLLLLLRMAAVAGVVLVLAQPLWQSRLGSLFGDVKTCHIVLLDDSFSMSDRWADTDAFAEAKRVVERIGAQASRQVHRQTFTLLRFSRAGRQPALPDMLQEKVDGGLADRLRATLESIRVSQTAAGPAAALEAAAQLVGGSSGDRTMVYLISDFRARQWDRADDFRDRLARLARLGARIQLIHCVDAVRANLAVAEFAPAPGIRAAGVPVMVEVSVKNHSDVPVKDVPVLIEADGDPRPGVTIAQIPPHQAATERFPVQFAAAGQHVLVAKLESDAVAADNLRYCVIDIPQDVPVLLVDGDPQALDARYLSAALAPGGPVPTGIRPRVENPRYLSRNPLEPFRSIYLVNIDALDERAAAALEAYVRSGGGLGVFLGERTRIPFINETLYRGGEGWFPAPLERQAELPIDRLQNAPDLEVSPHPIFRVFAGERNSFLSTVRVERYFSVPTGWQPKPDSGTRVIACLRGGAPLAIERHFGEGRVVAFLTTAAPNWNNWARNNPSFVVAMLELQAYLGGRAGQAASALVGEPIELDLDALPSSDPVRFAAPGSEALPPVSIQPAPKPDGSLAVVLPAAEQSGVGQLTLMRGEGMREVRRIAFNVEAEEGDLRVAAGTELAERLAGLDYQLHQAAAFEYAEEQLAGYNMTRPLVYLLVAILLAEQALAYSASYHPSRRSGLGFTAKGGPR